MISRESSAVGIAPSVDATLTRAYELVSVCTADTVGVRVAGLGGWADGPDRVHTDSSAIVVVFLCQVAAPCSAQTALVGIVVAAVRYKSSERHGKVRDTGPRSSRSRVAAEGVLALVVVSAGLAYSELRDALVCGAVESLSTVRTVQTEGPCSNPHTESCSGTANVGVAGTVS